jgi:nitroimidazol reductase NimA-like FMN-containing flavoprotein (pyridoxamine 5'-phosphate oxidase superfamily)
MLIHTLTSSECRDVLSSARIVHVACARDNQPYVVPLSLYYHPDDNALYGFSTVGRKIEWMRGNARVCVEAAEIVSRTEWTTVVAFGRYEEIPRRTPAGPVLRRAYDLFQTQTRWWLPGAASLSSGQEHADAVIYRIKLGRMTGRRLSES